MKIVTDAGGAPGAKWDMERPSSDWLGSE